MFLRPHHERSTARPGPGEAAPSDAARLAALLEVRARAAISAALEGRHRSPLAGGSSEFFDFRAYSAGEPAARVDWKRAARTDRLYIRRSAHEARLSVGVVLDASASMNYRDPGRHGGVLKFDCARLLAAAICLAAVRQGDAAGVATLDGQGNPTALPLSVGPNSARSALTLLSASGPLAPAFDAGRSLVNVAQAAASVWRSAGLIVVLTDGLDEPGALADALGRLCTGPGARADLVILRVLTRAERTLEGVPSGTAVDPERAVRALLTQGSAGYRSALRAQLAAVDRLTRRLGGRVIDVDPDEPAASALRRMMHAAQRGAPAR